MQTDLLALFSDMAIHLPRYPHGIELCGRSRRRRKAGGDWLAVWQAAERLGGVSAKLIYRMYHAGELEGVKVAGTVRIRSASVAAYLDAHSNKTAPPDQLAECVQDRPQTAKRRTRGSTLGFMHLRPPP